MSWAEEAPAAAPAKATAVASKEAKRRFDLPADTAEKALKAFSAQAGVEVLFSSDAAAGVRTRPVKGEFTPLEAANLMLDGTVLYVRDEKNGVVRIAKAIDPNAQRVALEKSSDRPDQSKIEDGKLVLDTVEVTGSRIRSLVGEQSIQPVLTISSQQIERTGVSSLGEIFRYIPQVSSASTGQLIQATNRFGSEFASLTSTRVTATLRGSPVGGTLLLVNGRRMPKTGQENGADGYDLSGIPISSVERIDVLLDGASSVYGADAMGGVINVILKKNYRGTELQLNYENTFDTDSAVKTATLTHSFSHGRLAGTLSISHEEANEMMWRDRWFLSSFDRRPFGGSDIRFGVGGRGEIQSLSGGNLPGLSTNHVGIPAGSDGVDVTVQDYANAPLPPVADLADISYYSTPYERRTVSGNVEYRIKDWLKPFADVRWNESSTETVGAPIQAEELFVPAGAPGNPFGVPVLLTKMFHDVPVAARENRNVNLAVIAGIRGDLPNAWRYQSTASLARSRPDLSLAGPTLFIDDQLAEEAFAAGQRPILLYDSTIGVSANPPGTLEAFSPRQAGGAENAETWTYDFQADGSVFHLPAGEVKMAVGAEYREEYVDFPRQLSTSAFARARNAYTSGYFVEMNAPLISAEQGIPLVNRLEIRAAARHDRYTNFASDTNPSVGLLYRPTKWLILRGSYSEGYKVPTLSQLYAPQFSFFSRFPIGSALFLDPLRNFEPLVWTGAGMPVVRSGNAALRPERSKTSNAGVVLDVPRVKGLSFSVSYFDTEYLDRAGPITLTDRIALFPEMVTRGPRRPTDPVDWPGPVIAYNDSVVNVASERISGWDAAGKYNVVTRFGEITVNLAASRVTRREVRAAPHLAPSILSTAASLPMQASGWIFWNKGPYDLGLLFTHRARFHTLTTSTFSTPAATRWDVQGSYNFSQSSKLKHDSWWGKALKDTRIRVTIFNVLNELPPFAQSGLPDNTVVDSRLRRYAVSLTKKF